MTIYNLYMFDRDGQLLHYAEWIRKKQSGMSREEEAKLMYGMIFSIKSFVTKVSPVDLKEGYLTYCTNKYRLHLFETPSRIKFVLNTDVAAQGIKELLHQIYTQMEEVVDEFAIKYIQPLMSQYRISCAKSGFLQLLDICPVKSRNQNRIQVYVEYVVFNPMCPLNKPIESELFAAKLDEVVRQSPAHASRPA